jgi:hypothetical protein
MERSALTLGTECPAEVSILSYYCQINYDVQCFFATAKIVYAFSALAHNLLFNKINID